MRGLSDKAADVGEGLAMGLFILAVIGIPVVTWFTHIFVCLKTAAWGFLIAGAIFFPIGIIHGIGIWLGMW